MKKDPLVSILVPVYGTEAYVERCSQSLFNQTYENIEVIFVNDCTKDNSIFLIEQSAKRNGFNNYRIVNHTVNRGLGQARGTGLAEAKGDYVTFVDSDDWIEQTMIFELIQAALTEEADIVCGSYNNVWPQKTLTVNHCHLQKKKFIEEILLNRIPGSIWGKLYSKKLFTEHPELRYVEGIDYGEDYYMTPRLFYYANKLSFVDKGLYNYNLCNVKSYIHSFSEKSMNSILKADVIIEDFFKDKFSKEFIDLAKLRTKLLIIKQGNPQLYKKLSAIYSDVPKSVTKKLSITDRILLCTINHGFNRLIASYINWRLL